MTDTDKVNAWAKAHGFDSIDPADCFLEPLQAYNSRLTAIMISIAAAQLDQMAEARAILADDVKYEAGPADAETIEDEGAPT